MLTIKEIRQKLEDRKLQIVAEKTGVHYNTLKKIKDGKNDNPTLKVIKAISDYLEGAGK
jgi:DNA-binding Xre family transcriptional regulator